MTCAFSRIMARGRRAAALMAVLAICALAGGATASRQREEPSPPTGLVLEVVADKEHEPLHIAVPGAGSEPRGAWSPRFRRIPSFQPKPGAPPIKAVNVTSRVEGMGVRVFVSVLSGERTIESEEAVASYLVGTNETVVVKELERFGIEPFEIRVVRVTPVGPTLPRVENAAESIVVLGVEANESTLPSYTVTLQNRSPKSVVALKIEGYVDGVRRLQAMPHGRDGAALVEPGATHRLPVPGMGRVEAISGSAVPTSPETEVIAIATAVFDDGSYEGSAEHAAAIRAIMLGRKIQIERVIALLDRALAAPGGEVPPVSALEKEVSALSTRPDAAATAELFGAFPVLDEVARNRARIALEVALAGVKTDVLAGLEELEKSLPSGPAETSVRAWLTATRDRYAAWLSRL